MALRITRGRTLLVIAAVIGATLVYLRDPAWLLTHTHGFYEETIDGERVRWTGGRAAFFVPSDLRAVRIRLRDVRDQGADWPITATLTVDDRVVDRLTFEDETWREVVVRLPPSASRRARRIDLKLDRLRARQRGVQFGPIDELR